MKKGMRERERERERERLMVMVCVVVHLVNHLNKNFRPLFIYSNACLKKISQQDSIKN